MKFIKKIIFITSLSILSTNSMAGTLTTDQVQNLLDRVEKAFHEKDVKAVEASIAHNFVLNVTWEVNGKTAYSSFTKETYISSLKENWSKDTGYKYEKIDTEIKLLNESSAMVRATVKESAINENKRMHWETQEKVIVRLIDGKVVATEIEARSKM